MEEGEFNVDNMTLAQLEEFEQGLALKLSIAKARKEKIIRETELTRPQVISVISFDTTSEIIKVETNGIPREDLLMVFRNIPSRKYDYILKQNTLHVKDWKDLVFKAKALPNVEITIPPDIEESIVNYINEPLIYVCKGSKDIEIRLAKRSRDWYIFSKIPGQAVIHSAKENKSIIHVPYSEAWRLGQVIHEYDDKIVDDETLKLIEDQTKARIKLDTIAQLEDCDLEVDMNGHTLRNFQKVGVKFALLALGEISE